MVWEDDKGRLGGEGKSLNWKSSLRFFPLLFPNLSFGFGRVEMWCVVRKASMVLHHEALDVGERGGRGRR